MGGRAWLTSLCCSYDVLLAGSEGEILGKFFDFGAKVVFSAEDLCRPDESLAVCDA